jgi:hypothetical protein
MLYADSRYIQFALIKTYFSKCNVDTNKQTTPKPYETLYKYKTYRQVHNYKNKCITVAFSITCHMSVQYGSDLTNTPN